MLEGLFMRKIASTNDGRERERIQEILSANHIAYKIQAEDIASRGIGNDPRMGFFGGAGPKPSYSVYVKKKDADYALHLIRS